MDILYVIGTGSMWDNNELKYSLRSIERYGKNVGRIFIAGNKPDFLNNNVIHIPCEDIGEAKHTRILNKVITAMNSGLLPDHFLISSDDHFYIKETDFNELPVYYKNDVIKGSDKNKYRKSLAETKQFLEENNLTTFQTNPHCNTHWDVNIYNKYKELFEKGKTLEHGAEMNCLMGNLLIKEGFPYQKYHDVKVKSRSQLDIKLQNSECFSIYDCAIPLGIEKYLSCQFPDKCKYEC